MLCESTLVSGGYDNTIRIWKIGAERGKLIRTLAGHTGWVNAVIALPLGGGRRQLIASTSEDKTMRVWSATTGKCISVLKGHSRGVVGVAALSNGNVVTSSRDKLLCVWSALHWEQKA
jgi:WD40 repeat protein